MGKTSVLIFSKHLADISLEDIQSFFASPKTESLILEFKTFNTKDTNSLESKENDIIKCLCAFINTEGGLLIWGAPDGIAHKKPDGTKEKLFSGQLCPVTNDISKDKFISKITSLIIPAPSGVAIHQIPANGNGFIYLIEAEKSLYPPHQFQNIYHMRLDGQNKPAPHSYVEALMKQVKYPNINCFLMTDFASFPTRGHFGAIPFHLIMGNFSQFITAFNVYYTLSVDKGTFFFRDEDLEIMPYGRQVNDSLMAKTLHYNRPVSIDLFLLLPEKYGGTYEFTIRLSFYADNTPIKYSKYFFTATAHPNHPTPQISLIKKVENQMVLEDEDLLGNSEEQKVKGFFNGHLEKMKFDMWEQPFMKKLN